MFNYISQVSEVTLQHCVLKALLTVLDSGPGLCWVLSNSRETSNGGEDNGDYAALEDIFLSIQVNLHPLQLHHFFLSFISISNALNV